MGGLPKEPVEWIVRVIELDYVYMMMRAWEAPSLVFTAFVAE